MGNTSDGIARKTNSEMRVELETRNSWQLFPLLDLKKQKNPKAQDNLVEAGTMRSLPTKLERKEEMATPPWKASYSTVEGRITLASLLSSLCSPSSISHVKASQYGSLEEAAFRPQSSCNTEQWRKGTKKEFEGKQTQDQHT